MRHRTRDWTTAVVSWQVKTSSVWFYLSNGCRTRNPAALTAGIHLFPPPYTRFFVPLSLWMMGRGLRLRRDDGARPRSIFRKLRFQMIADIPDLDHAKRTV